VTATPPVVLEARVDERRQDEPARVRLRRHLAEPPLRDGAEPLVPGRTAGGLERRLAAALAAASQDAALGTDSGGSIRIPAACCRVVGFKPTFGLVSTDGVFPLAPSYDHAGPMARDVETCAALMRLLGGVGSAAGPFRVALAWHERAEPLVRERLEEAGRLLGARPVEFPLPEGTTQVFMREVADVHRELYAEHADLPTARTSGRRSSAASSSPTPSGGRRGGARRLRA
jgi:aspartyl-tRNA(Asn)/glutamyl-tRNA(Gln) amidotransferase subunit A